MAKVKKLTDAQQDALDETIFNDLVKRFSKALIKEKNENLHKKPAKSRTGRRNPSN